MHHKFPEYSTGERLADGYIHIVGVASSLVAAATLVVIAFHGLPALSIASLIIYGVGLVAVFGFSAGYHLVTPGKLKSILRRFDHAAIYLKIAATYTPFAMVKMGGPAGFALLGVVWAITVFGVSSKLLWPDGLVRTSYALYLAQGWACVAALSPLTAAVSGQTLFLLLLGGALYTIGVVFHLWRTLPYHNAIWHGFVLTASGCHFAAIVDAIAFDKTT